MNKIYKVIWSKAKHCYVVTSELAKRNGKGCGARSLRMAAVTTGVTAALLCNGGGLPFCSPSVAEAANVFEYENTSPITLEASSGNTYLATMNEKDYVFGNFKFTVKNDPIVTPNIYVISPKAETRKVGSITINVRQIIMSEDNDYPASNCSVTMTGGTLGHLYGAYGGTTNAESNKVTVSGGTVSELYGGYSLAGAANGNTVEISGATVSNLHGGYGKTGADGNKLTVNNSTVLIVRGGSGYDGPATHNTVKIGSGTNFSGSEYYRQVVGGFSNTGAVSGNTVEISGGEISCPSLGVYGGWSNENAASDNTVTISGGTVSGNVYGGWTTNGTAGGANADDGNKVIINGGTINDDVYGGYSSNKNATGNTVTISGGTAYKVYGAFTEGGAAETNHVVLNGGIAGVSGTIVSGGELYGAYSYNDSGNSGDVTGNTVTVKKGTVMATVYGGDTKAEGTGNQSGDAIKNTVTIEDGTLAGSIYGGYSSAQYKTSGNVEGNQVEIKGGVLKSAPVTINGTNYNTDGVRYIRGGYTSGYDKDTDTNASGIAKDNTVTISGGTLRSDTEVTGGYSNANNAEHNIVKIESTYTGTAGNVIGGEAGGNGTAKKNEVTISGGMVRESNDSNYHVFGGKTNTGSATNNKVTINKNATVNSHVAGGFTETGKAENNEVTIDGGNVNGVVGGGVARIEGATSGSVTGNTVTINNGSKVGFQNDSGIYGGFIAGGYSYSWVGDAGAATENKVFIKGGEVYDVYGGLSGIGDVTWGSETYNSGDATKNEVEISGGTVSGGVYGGWTTNGAAGGSADAGNKVTVDGKASLYGVYGGYSQSGAVSYNTVDVKDCEWAGAFGGYSESGGAVSYNTVTMSDGNSFGLYGGENYNGTGDVTHNTVTLKGGSVQGYLFGGYIDEYATDGTGKATNNKVEISGGTVTQHGYGYVLAGGRTKDGDALDNTVIISAGEIGKWNGARNDKTTLQIAGGYVYGYKGKATGNAVDISGGTFGGAYEIDTTIGVETGELGIVVFGGYTNGTDSGIAASDNTVTISGSAVLTGAATVAGGTVNLDKELDAKGSADNNTVDISGGTIGTGDKDSNIYGGLGGGTASGNTVTIKEKAELNKNTNVYGGKAAVYYEVIKDGQWGYEEELSGTASDNTVNIEKAVTVKGLYGGAGDTTKSTGNTLNVKATGVKADEVKYFQTVAMHSLTWDTSVAALEATTMEGINTLDITDLQFDQTPATGSMSLLKTTDSDLSTVKLTYDDTHKDITITTDGIVLGGGGTEKTETTGEKGVKVTRTVNEKVSLATDSKAINYDIEESNNVTKITLGEVNTKDPRDMSGTGFDFANTAKVDASGLKLIIEQPVDITKAMVPLVTNATNLKAGVAVDYGTGKTNHTQDISLTHDATGIDVGATMTGQVMTKASEVDYLVTGATVNSLDLTGWNGAVVSETLVGVKGKTGGVTVTTGEFALPEISTESVTILAMGTENFFGTVTGKRQYGDTPYENDTENGVTLSGKKTGGVKTEDSGKKLTYYAMKNTAETMTFGEVEFKKDGVARDLKNAYTFDGASTINAKDLTFKDTTEALQKDNSMTLAANAKGITSANAVTQPTNPDIAIAYTDTQGIKFGATAVGTVTAVTNAVQYTVDSVAVNSIGLGGWRGTASAVPTGWALAEGATVDTKDMTEPTAAATIITSGTDDFFKAATISGGKEYKETDFSEEDSGIAFAGKQAKGVKAEGKNLVYALGDKNVTKATVTGEIKWDTEKVYYENTKYAFTDSSKTDISKVKFTATADPLLNQSMTLIKNNVAGTVTEGTPEFTVNMKNTTMEATATGTASIDSGNLQFTVNGVTLNKVTVNGVGSDAVPEGWTAAEDLTVDTSKMELPADMPAAGEEVTILKGSDKIQFSDADISGDNKYGNNPDRFTEEDKTQGAVTIAGKQDKGVVAGADGKSLVYKVGTKDVSSISLGTVKWASGTTLLDASDKAYNFADVTALEGSFAMNYDTPEDVAAKQSMTLLKANETLQDMAKEETNTHQYTNEPVAGVTVSATITGKLAAKDKAVTFTVDSNKASSLTFGKVEWTGSNPLIDHKTTLKNVSFDGATVDTSNIDFYKEMYIEADQTTTLVSDFGGKPKEIIGSKYMVGTAFEGEGSATMENGNLIFHTKTSAGVSEQTHKAVMGVEATMGLLATGKEHADKVLDGLGNLSNVGLDGTSVAASFGGGEDRYETNSHVNINSWSAAVGVGARKETKKGTLQYGIFGEYGKGSYTMHSDVGRSDGDAHYAGGGLMAKWTNKHDVYTEASFRLGRVSDSTNDLLRDGAGNAYGYDIHATYYGAHVGLGKVFNYKGGKSLDVYGKFFYTKRDGAEFDAKQHYNLDSVNSSVLRIGARYGTTDKKWNWYGGLAYEYEFDGEAKGTVNGTEIRAASIKGSSVRGEFGMRMDATKDNPWRTDISIYGYGGKHRGFGGSVNVAYTF